MKTLHSIIKISTIAALAVLFSSCADFLNQPSRVDLPSSAFWQDVNDAEYALNGAVADIRYLFDRDYYLDAMGEYVNVSGNVLQRTADNEDPSEALKNGAAYDGFYELYPTGYGGQFSNMYRYCYGGVNRCNYVIDGIQKMIAEGQTEADEEKLNEFIGEAKLFRALIYLRLISMWGDVPYINERIMYKEDVEHLYRTPIATIKDSLVSDLTDAFNKLPEKASKSGRMTKAAALGLRGKVQLYWASWNKFGWPELAGFTPDAQEAQEAYEAAASDFRHVIDDYGLTLFRNGEPGDCDELGKAEILPNYYYLFLPTANGDSEFIITFNHGGTGTSQGEHLMADFGGRSTEYANGWLNPRYAIADRYQSTITGDFCEPLVPTPASDPNARTAPNSALNPQSYANRDYRMKASILWDYEMIQGLMDRKETGWVPFIYKTWAVENYEINGQYYTTYETDRCWTGYVWRKFVRNYAGQTAHEGDYNWPVMRLADVYLMYAEAVNFANLEDQKPYAIELVNRVRHRGNLPPLAADKTGTQDAFFDAINQERIVELLAEGHRMFDLRRWRLIEESFCGPGDATGYVIRDTWGNPISGFSTNGTIFQNTTNRAYEQCYIFQIPESERNRNPNLTQNTPWM